MLFRCHDAEALGGAGGWSEGAADPDGAFVEVRQELGADDAAEAEKDGEQKDEGCEGDRDVVMLDGPADGAAVVAREPGHHRIFPLAGALGEGEAGEDRSDENGEQEAAKQSEAYHPGHGLEEAALNRSEERRVGKECRTRWSRYH